MSWDDRDEPGKSRPVEWQCLTVWETEELARDRRKKDNAFGIAISLLIIPILALPYNDWSDLADSPVPFMFIGGIIAGVISYVSSRSVSYFEQLAHERYLAMRERLEGEERQRSASAVTIP